MQLDHLRGVLAAAVLLATTACWPIAGPLRAEPGYPAKPIRMVIPFPPGGSNDIVGRVVAQGIGDRLGKAVVVENKAGAGGIIGAETVARAAPDGYTILLISSSFTMNPALQKLSYDPARSFVPVTMLGSAPSVLAVNAALGTSTLADLIALAKQRPNQIRLAAAGAGSYQHLISEQFRLMTGTDFLIVQYKGGAPALNDLVSGHADFSVGTVIYTLPFITSGQVKALAVAGPKRIAALPEIPTATEAGVAGYDASNWWGLLAPAGTPAAVVDLLYRTVADVLDAPDVKKRFDAEGAEIVRMPPDEMGRYLASEMTKWADVVRKASIKLE